MASSAQAVDPGWYNPESAWWAKLRRAARHIKEVQERTAEFEAREPWSVESTAGPAPNEMTFVLRVRQPVPSDLITAIGDAIHNMRSALDAVAFEFARVNVGKLNATQERLIQFPIVEDGSKFDSFFTASIKGEDGDKFVRRDLYSDAQILAFRCVQSFAFSEEGAALGVENRLPTVEEYKHHVLNRLHTLSVIDKHRRLPILAWFTDLVYWQGESEEVQQTYRWRPAPLVSPAYVDGAVLGSFVNPTGSTPPNARLTHAMMLTFGDDPSGPHSGFAEALSSWHDSIKNWILPRAFIVAAGNPPPLGIWSA